MGVQMCHSPDIHRTGRLAEGKAKGKHKGKEGREEFSGKTRV